MLIQKWSKSLCQLDSDNDGKSNGEELGDPNCVWAPGKSVQKKTGLTHPGKKHLKIGYLTFH